MPIRLTSSANDGIATRQARVRQWHTAAVQHVVEEEGDAAALTVPSVSVQASRRGALRYASCCTRSRARVRNMSMVPLFSAATAMVTASWSVEAHDQQQRRGRGQHDSWQCGPSQARGSECGVRESERVCWRHPITLVGWKFLTQQTKALAEEAEAAKATMWSGLCSGMAFTEHERQRHRRAQSIKGNEGERGVAGVWCCAVCECEYEAEGRGGRGREKSQRKEH